MKTVDHAELVARREGVGRAPDALDAKIDAYNKRHRAADCEWLAGLLHEKGADGDRRARRMLSHFAEYFTLQGARVPVPTWPPIWSPERADEIDS